MVDHNLHTASILHQFCAQVRCAGSAHHFKPGNPQADVTAGATAGPSLGQLNNVQLGRESTQLPPGQAHPAWAAQ